MRKAIMVQERIEKRRVAVVMSPLYTEPSVCKEFVEWWTIKSNTDPEIIESLRILCEYGFLVVTMTYGIGVKRASIGEIIRQIQKEFNLQMKPAAINLMVNKALCFLGFKALDYSQEVRDMAMVLNQRHLERINNNPFEKPPLAVLPFSYELFTFLRAKMLEKGALISNNWVCWKGGYLEFLEEFVVERGLWPKDHPLDYKVKKWLRDCVLCIRRKGLMKSDKTRGQREGFYFLADPLIHFDLTKKKQEDERTKKVLDKLEEVTKMVETKEAEVVVVEKKVKPKVQRRFVQFLRIWLESAQKNGEMVDGKVMVNGKPVDLLQKYAIEEPKKFWLAFSRAVTKAGLMTFTGNGRSLVYTIVDIQDSDRWPIEEIKDKPIAKKKKTITLKEAGDRVILNLTRKQAKLVADILEGLIKVQKDDLGGLKEQANRAIETVKKAEKEVNDLEAITKDLTK